MAPVVRVGLALLQVGLSASGVPLPIACLTGQSADSSAQLMTLALSLFGTPASATASGARADVSQLLQGVSGEGGLTRPAYEAVAVLLRQVDGMARGGDTWAGSSARPEDTRRGSKTARK